MFSLQTYSTCFAIIMAVSSFSWAQRAYNTSKPAISPMDAGGGGSGESTQVKKSTASIMSLDGILPALSADEKTSILGLQYSREEFYRPPFLDGDNDLYIIYINDGDGNKFGDYINSGNTLKNDVDNFARDFNLLSQWNIIKNNYYSYKIDGGETRFYPGSINYKGSKVIHRGSGMNLCGKSAFSAKITEAFEGTGALPVSQKAIYIALIDDSQGFSYQSSCTSTNLALGQRGPQGYQCSLHDFFVVKNTELFFGLVKVPSSESNCLIRMDAVTPSDSTATTKTSSVLNGVFHEIVEGVLSPYPGQAWSVKSPKTGNYFEVADICETVFLNNKKIQSIYNPTTKRCEV